MRSRTRNWVFTGLVLALLAGQTGCKSGWKMPGSDMFSWGRKPSESTLVGNGPSISTPGSTTASATPRSATPPASAPIGTPVSPALRSTPNQVASTALNPGAANPNASGRPNGTSFGGYGPNSTPYGSTASAAPGPGAAASANGYTTGAYATGQPRAPMGVNSAPYGQLASNPALGMQPQGPQMQGPQMQNPQMQGPQLAGAQSPSGQGVSFAQGPSSLPTANQNFNFPSSAQVAGPSPQVYGGMTVPRGPSAIAAAPGGALPPATVPSGGSMIPPTAPTANGLPVARTASAQGVPAMPVSSGTNLPPGLPPNSQMPVAYGGTAPSSMPVMSTPTSSGATPYLPGSVGRNTPYNFSNQGPGATPAAPAPSFPRTATDPYAIPNR